MDTRKTFKSWRRNSLSSNLLGLSHPLKNAVHDAVKPVSGKNIEYWVEEWIRWLISIPPEKSPLVPDYRSNPFEKDATQTHKARGSKEGVWFLAAPVYGRGLVGTYSRYVSIERGKNHILLAPVMFYNSGDNFGEYPSKSAKELFNMAVDDLKAVNEIEVRLDGLNLHCSRVEIDKPFPVAVKYPNILGIDKVEFGKNKQRDVQMVAAGYITFLNILEPGLHKLTYEAYTKNYSLSAQFQLNVRGP